MNEEQEIAEVGAKRELYDAFWKDSSAAIKPFREYWRKSGDVSRDASKVLREVMFGATLISDEVLQTCRYAVMRLHQHADVLARLTSDISKVTDDRTKQAALDIVARAMKEAANAKQDMVTIYEWVAAAEPTKDKQP
ncbi:hypothetical protein ACI2TO_23560 [Ralstonia nicotianae]